MELNMKGLQKEIRKYMSDMLQATGKREIPVTKYSKIIKLKTTRRVSRLY